MARRIGHIAGTTTMKTPSTRALRALALAFSLVAIRGDAQSDSARRLSLREAVQLAATGSDAIRAARFHTQEMSAAADEKHAALLPRADAEWMDGGHSFNTASFGIPFPGFSPHGSIIGPVRAIDIRGRISAPIFDAAARSDYRNAQAAVTRAGADADAAVQSVQLATASAYVRAERAEAQLRARAADSLLAKQLLDIANGELQAGTGVVLDVTRAQTQVARVRAQLGAARSERNRAQLELLRTIGLPLTTSLILTDSLDSPVAVTPQPSADDAVAEALRSRADVRAGADAVAASARAVSAMHAERYPDVSAFVDGGWTSAAYPYLQATHNYGIQLSYPIFDGSRRESRIAERSAALHAAEGRQRALETSVAAEVRSALFELTSASDQVSAARDAVTLAETAVAQARDRFATGVAGSGDVVSAQLELSAARIQFVDALTALQSARVSFASAQGHLANIP